MSLYCMCATASDLVLGDPPNKYAAPQTAEFWPPVVLQRKMECIKTGAQQMIRLSGGELHKHYPNVDIFECSNCGARVVKE